MKMIYDYPLYYEIAFSFFDPKAQVDAFEHIINKFSRIKVKRFLDIACGPSLQLREISRRGYEAVGLDSSREMLTYLSEKARENHTKIRTVQADMFSFHLREKADFAFIMMGSLTVKSNMEFLNHLDSVASSLKKGGLYLIQNRMLNWTDQLEQYWIMERDGVTVKTRFSYHFWTDILKQMYEEKGSFEINDHGKQKKLSIHNEFKFIFPQEFKTLITLNRKFEFLGWWPGNENTWNLDQPLENNKTPSNINITLLRKKQ